MKLCLGTVQFGLRYGIAKNDRPEKEECFKILDCAMANGIDTFDTAKAYGESEKILCEYFKDKKRSDFKIATKFEKVTATKEEFVEEVESSLENLGLDYLDYYLLHKADSVNYPDTMAGLEYIKQKGYIKTAGASVYSPEEAMLALESPYIDCIQIPYNIIDKRFDKYGFFEKAIKYNKTIFCRSMLLQGLFLIDPEKAEERVKTSGAVVKTYQNFCSRYGISPLEMAIGYMKQKKGVDYIVFGVDNLNQLKEQLELQKIIIPEDAVKEADELFKDVDDFVLDPRQWNTWGK